MSKKGFVCRAGDIAKIETEMFALMGLTVLRMHFKLQNMERWGLQRRLGGSRKRPIGEPKENPMAGNVIVGSALYEVAADARAQVVMAKALTMFDWTSSPVSGHNADTGTQTPSR